MIKASLRKDGRWEAKGIDPLTGQRKSYYSRLGAEAAERLAEASFGISREDTSTLYGFYSNVYLPTVAQRSQNWTSQIGWAMDKHILPRFGERRLEDLDRRELQLFFNGLAPTMTASTIRGIKIIFSGILNLAEDDGLIQNNPCRRVRISGKPSTRRKALSAPELWKLLEVSHDRVRPLVLLAGFAGLRLGEALAVTRGHISRDGILSVRQQVLQPKGGCIVSDKLKTDQSRREIPLPEPFLDMLLSSGQVSSIYVCSNSVGGYLTPNNAQRELEIAIAAARITRVTPHELRHTFTTLLENEVVAPRAIAAALLGKSDRSQIGVYSHPTPRQMRPWMEKYWQTVIGCKDRGQADAASTTLTTTAVVKEA